MKNPLVLLFLLLPIHLLASNENHLAGARSHSMGNASVALIDQWGTFNNQAVLAKLEHISIGAYYENRFETKDLSTKTLHFNYPSKIGTFSLSYKQFGFDLYKESKIGFAYSRALGKHFWAGLQFDQIKKELNQSYGSQSQYTFEIGILAEILTDIYLGFHVFNPSQTNFTTFDYEDKIPCIARFGLSWKLSEQAIITSEIEKDLDQEMKTKFGMEYTITDKISLRAGVHNHPNSISMGVGFSFEMVKANVSFSRHPVLGYTPAADLMISF
ncbi:hypothetical protein [Labilibaculum sp.]|uniref:hypothetical protein n=1 Tax=Labilibaculum sp. TaxID=2060723 RepID=UPI003565BBB6